MPQNPGNLTVTFNPPGRFNEDRLHTQPASSDLSPFSQGGCTVQAATVRDKVDNTAYAEVTDKVITPYNDNTAGVTAEWYLTYNGDPKYRVIGVHGTPDAFGRIDHCTFFCKHEEG